MADSNTVTTVPVLNNVTGNLNATLPTTVQVAKMINWLTFAIGLPAIGLAIYILKNLSKGEKKMPMHVVFLLISDVVSFFSRPHTGQQTGSEVVTSSNPTDFIFYFGVISNISLMLFIAQEHHVLVAYPRCVGCCGNIRRSVVVALIAWAAPFAVLALAVLQYNLWFAVAMLTPFPFLLFFAVDSWRALICSRSNPSTPERRRTVWGLAAMWANYTFLYCPFILSVLLDALSFQETVQYLGLVSHLLLFLGPLVDPFLYVLMTKGFREVLHALPCCKKTPQTQDMRPTVDTVAETVETRL
ncbi:adrenocorticotropic hormone receptor-like [Thunnus thynnus]|uniref:adrenocorticotropic hormone receptor-like n=1 Tax=Thunnus thynnus TaxID=8237 RepID=UPI0035292533|eukprot:superscaffoldBa00001430_g10501